MLFRSALVVFKNVSVSYNGCPVLDGITWTIKQGDFWELVGPNGSGKTTLLTLITGDNHKGYGQDLTLFGQKKGSEKVFGTLRRVLDILHLVLLINLADIIQL